MYRPLVFRQKPCVRVCACVCVYMYTVYKNRWEAEVKIEITPIMVSQWLALNLQHSCQRLGAAESEINIIKNIM